MPFEPTYPVTEDRRAYTFIAGRTGLLVLHGFMGSPLSSRPLAQHLHKQGITVHCPLLPGHGERPDKLHNIPRRAWLDAAEEGLATIRQYCDEIFLLGHSMGSVLGASLAAQNSDLRGLIMLAPLYVVPSRILSFTGLLRHVLPWFSPWRIKRLQPLARERVLDLYPDLDLEDPRVQAQLPQMTRVPLSGLAEMSKMAGHGRKLWPRLTLPALILQGQRDIAVRPGSAEAVHEALGSRDKHLSLYPRAGHELMRPKDPAHQQVWAEIEAFIRQRSTHLAAAPLQAEPSPAGER